MSHVMLSTFVPPTTWFRHKGMSHSTYMIQEAFIARPLAGSDLGMHLACCYDWLTGLAPPTVDPDLWLKFRRCSA